MADPIGLIGETLFSTGYHPSVEGIKGIWRVVASAQAGKFRAVQGEGDAEITLSLQPDGSQEIRTKARGGDGPFEKMSPSGTVLLFEYQWQGQSHAHVVAWRELTGVQGT